jgi:hypothetical protein
MLPTHSSYMHIIISFLCYFAIFSLINDGTIVNDVLQLMWKQMAVVSFKGLF